MINGDISIQFFLKNPLREKLRTSCLSDVVRYLNDFTFVPTNMSFFKASTVVDTPQSSNARQAKHKVRYTCAYMICIPSSITALRSPYVWNNSCILPCRTDFLSPQPPCAYAIERPPCVFSWFQKWVCNLGRLCDKRFWWFRVAAVQGQSLMRRLCAFCVRHVLNCSFMCKELRYASSRCLILGRGPSITGSYEGTGACTTDRCGCETSIEANFVQKSEWLKSDVYIRDDMRNWGHTPLSCLCDTEDEPPPRTQPPRTSSPFARSESLTQVLKEPWWDHPPRKIMVLRLCEQRARTTIITHGQTSR